MTDIDHASQMNGPGTQRSEESWTPVAMKLVTLVKLHARRAHDGNKAPNPRERTTSKKSRICANCFGCDCLSNASVVRTQSGLGASKRG